MTEAKTSSRTAATPGTSEFLRLEAEDAKAAAAKALADAKAALTRVVDPREATRAHPFIAVGSAAVAGFVAALLTIPTKEEQALRRIEKLHRAMHPEPQPAAKETNGSPKPPAQSFWMILLKETIAVLKPILIASVTAGLNGQANPPPSQPNPTDIPR